MAPTKRTHSGTSKEATHDAKARTMDEDAPKARPKRPNPGTSADTYFHNLYRTEIDFRQLAREDPAFAKLYAESHGAPPPV